MARPESMPAEDPLSDLRERIRATQEAAERLADGPRPAADEQTVHDARALIALLETLRDVVPPELWAQVRELIRQLLLLVRAAIDWWIDCVEQTPRGAAPEVEDIPIA